MARTVVYIHCDGKVRSMRELKAEKEKLLTLQSEQRKYEPATFRKMARDKTVIYPSGHVRKKDRKFPFLSDDLHFYTVYSHSPSS